MYNMIAESEGFRLYESSDYKVGEAIGYTDGYASGFDEGYKSCERHYKKLLHEANKQSLYFDKMKVIGIWFLLLGVLMERFLNLSTILILILLGCAFILAKEEVWIRKSKKGANKSWNKS